ncbi:MAG: hypothetical protein H7Z74_05660 [Anaerolineae bacterium]|nr:hypothetical protein [Gemmatimonadaceae bacterium]
MRVARYETEVQPIPVIDHRSILEGKHMADKDKEKDGYGVSSSRGASEGAGYGDDQGTRVGKPKDNNRESTGPSTRPVKEGLEGSILDSDQAQGKSGTSNQAAGKGDTSGETQGKGGTSGTTTGKGGTSGAGTEAEAEPVERTREHVSGYGGAGGTPKTSSDQREPQEPTGKKPA